MKIGLVAAMGIEIHGIESYMQDKKTVTAGAFTFTAGKINSCEVVSVTSGIGLVNAALATQMLIDRFNVDCVINPGVAGGLSQELNVCDIVVSKDCAYWDFSLEVLKMALPSMADNVFPAHTQLYEKCLAVCADIVRPNKLVLGRVVSGQRFVDDLDTKRKLNIDMQADCVEMEGAAIAHTCHLLGVPYLIVRSVSDSVRDNGEQAMVTFQEFLKLAADQVTKVMLALIGDIS